MHDSRGSSWILPKKMPFIWIHVANGSSDHQRRKNFWVVSLPRREPHPTNTHLLPISPVHPSWWLTTQLYGTQFLVKRGVFSLKKMAYACIYGLSLTFWHAPLSTFLSFCSNDQFLTMSPWVSLWFLWLLSCQEMPPSHAVLVSATRMTRTLPWLRHGDRWAASHRMVWKMFVIPQTMSVDYTIWLVNMD